MTHAWKVALSHGRKLLSTIILGVALPTLGFPRSVGCAAVPTNPIGASPHNWTTQAKAEINAGEVKALVVLPSSRLMSGEQVEVRVNIEVAPGWHIYGSPLPEGYTPTSVTFDTDLLVEQHLEFPKPTPIRFELLDETLPVYQGRFQVFGKLRLRPHLVSGEHNLNGTLSFQECNESLCKMPQSRRFTIPLWVDSVAAHSS